MCPLRCASRDDRCVRGRGIGNRIKALSHVRCPAPAKTVGFIRNGQIFRVRDGRWLPLPVTVQRERYNVARIER